MMNILSFDCANRSLAVCYLTINTNIMSDLAAAYKTGCVDKIRDAVNSYVAIRHLKVYDVTEGKKIGTVDRAHLLRGCLNSVDAALSELPEPWRTPHTVLVEYQMSANDKSRCVSQQLVYHYAGREGVTVELVGPSLKNKVCFTKELEYGVFAERYASKYTANKNHAKANLLYWLQLYDMKGVIEAGAIRKANLDDVADAFMQIFGWMVRQGGRR